MDLRQSHKGTYSKGGTKDQKTEEEKRAYYKQRKLLPKFSALFVGKENRKPEQATRDSCDSLCQGVKALGIFEDSLPGRKSSSFRKPLTVNSSLVNSSLGGVSHSSANDTFDKLVFVGKARVPQTSQVIAYSSSSGSSLDCSDMLFKSLLSSVSTLDSNWAKVTGLKSVPEAKECNEKEADVKQNVVACLHDGVDQPSRKTKLKSLPSENQGRVSPQLFSSDDDSLGSADGDSLDSADFRNKTGRTPDGQQSYKTGQKTKGIRGRNGPQTKKGKKSTNEVDVVGVISPTVVSDKDGVERICSYSSTTKKDAKELATCLTVFNCRVPVIELTQIAAPTDCSVLGQKFSAAVDIVPPSVESKLESCSRVLPSPTDCLTIGQKRISRTSQKSYGSQHSGKSSVKSDICTSTPTNTSRHRTVSKSGSHWSLHASPSLENALSPVPRDNSLITVDTSSVFESPMSFKENSIVSSNKVRTGPSLGSKYESCLSSHNFEISRPASKPLALSRESVEDSSSCDRENPSQESYNNSSKEITHGPVKGVFIPVYDPKETSNDKLSPFQTVQKDLQADSTSVSSLPVKASRDIEEVSPVIVNFTKRRRICSLKKLLKRLQSSRDTSVVEKSALFTQRDRKISVTPDLSHVLPSRIRRQKSKGDQYPLPSRRIQKSDAESDDDVLEGSHENSEVVNLTELKAKRSAVDGQSMILRRKSRVEQSSRNQSSGLRHSPALLRRRTSKRLFRRKCKSTFGNVVSSQESSSCTSTLSTDNEEPPGLTKGTRLTNHNRNQLFDTDQSPIFRRRASMRLLKRSTVILDSVTDDGNELQVLPVQTRRSVRLLLKNNTRPPDVEGELKVPPGQNRRSIRQLLKISVSQGDSTDDEEELQVPSVQTRRSARQFARECGTRSNMKNGTKVREELSMMDISILSVRSMKAGFNCTGVCAASDNSLSENCVIAAFKKRIKRKEDQPVYYKASSIQDFFSSSAESFEGSRTIEEKEIDSLVPDNEVLNTEGKLDLRSKVLEQESDAFEEQDRIVGESSANEELESLKSQISMSESNSILKEPYWKKPNSSESIQESANKDGSVKFLQSVQNLNSLPELEDGVESLPFSSLIPVKRGKGWIRSLTNVALAQVSFNAEESFDAVRRQTVHRISTGQKKTSVLRMSAIPPEINKRIQQMGACPLEEVHSRSILEVTFLSDDGQKDYQLPSDPGEYVLQLCSQEKPVPFADCFTETRLTCCKKIGEGVYGEVFMTRLNPNSMEGATVLKIMPIEGSFPVNGEPQKKFEEILSEIIISTELSNLQKPHRQENWTENFVHVLKSWCVQGRYHQNLLRLWDVFHEEKGSENDRPDIFPDSQLYIVLEFGHGGQDLESYIFNSARDALAVFLQMAYSLAVAEQELEFEHRDLHWGNVLVAQTPVDSIEYKLNGRSYNLQTHGLKATVIDFTLSRMKAPHCVVYNNLAEDPSLFTAEGDYQFEIYRQMKKANENEWEKFTPYTNVLWLHYILDKMTSECYFKNVKTKVHRTHHAQISKMKDEMLDYKSATDFVLQRELDLQ